MPGNTGGESSPANLELRIATRYEFNADIEIEWLSKRIWRRITNISASGMFIELSELPERNARFFANLALNKPLRIECVVRRVAPGRGIGVTIAIPDQRERVRYQALLVALAMGSGPVAAGVQIPLEGEPERPLVACAR